MVENIVLIQIPRFIMTCAVSHGVTALQLQCCSSPRLHEVYTGTQVVTLEPRSNSRGYDHSSTSLPRSRHPEDTKLSIIARTDQDHEDDEHDLLSGSKLVAGDTANLSVSNTITRFRTDCFYYVSGVHLSGLAPGRQGVY